MGGVFVCDVKSISLGNLLRIDEGALYFFFVYNMCCDLCVFFFVCRHSTNLLKIIDVDFNASTLLC